MVDSFFHTHRGTDLWTPLHDEEIYHQYSLTALTTVYARDMGETVNMGGRE